MIILIIAKDLAPDLPKSLRFLGGCDNGVPIGIDYICCVLFGVACESLDGCEEGPSVGRILDFVYDFSPYLVMECVILISEYASVVRNL